MVSSDLGGLHRDQFPILKKKKYLASHSMGAVPLATKVAMQNYVTDWVDLGIEAWDGPFWKAIIDFQSLIGGLLGLPGSSVCPTGNVTRAMAGIASCFSYEGERNRILLSELEFTTSFPFWHGQVELGAELVVIPSSDGVGIGLEEFEKELDERTLLVVCSHAFFRSGSLCPELQEFTKAIHETGGKLLLDTYQTLGSVPVPAGEFGVDIIVGGCHKWLCGGPGAGFLAVNPNSLPDLIPRLTGWMGLADPFAYRKDSGRGVPHSTALRFLGGTPSVSALYAARPALELLSGIGVESIRRVSTNLSEYLKELLLDSGFSLKSPKNPERRNGMLCVELSEGQKVVEELAKQGFVLDYRPDCGLRVSPHFYNNAEELLSFVETLASVTK